MDILLTSENGCLYKYDIEQDKSTELFKAPHENKLMGLCRDNRYVYVSSESQIFKLDTASGYKCVSSADHIQPWKLCVSAHFFARRNPALHQMDIIDGDLLVAATGINEILRFNSHDLMIKTRHPIAPPIKYLPMRYKYNYNHLNNINRYQGKYYVTLNWNSSSQYGVSGVAVLNDKFREINRFEYGWETHNFCIIDGKKMSLCASSGLLKKINHPHKAGLLVDGELVFEHDPNTYFCKDFSVNDEFIVIVGGEIKERVERGNVSGVIFILNHEYEVLLTRTLSGSGGLKGCLLQDVDYTKYRSES